MSNIERKLEPRLGIPILRDQQITAHEQRGCFAQPLSTWRPNFRDLQPAQIAYSEGTQNRTVTVARTFLPGAEIPDPNVR